MNYLYLGLFALATGLHLYASATFNKRIRAVSKPVILISLLAFYIHTVPNPSSFVILAIVFSWLGDVFLIPNSVGCFTLGGISFLTSHVFFILAYIEKVNVFVSPWYIYVIFGGFFLIIAILMFIKLLKIMAKALAIPSFGYLLVNGAMNCFAIFRLFAGVSAASIITVVGAAMFFISDSILFIIRFDKNSKLKSHFPVMIFYCFAELLIVLGFVL